MDQLNFKRTEMKYMISREQFDMISDILNRYMVKDKYYFCTIQSLYFDTPNKLLIRRSLEKPIYKEKLRLRSYGLIQKDEKAFLEIKKKYDGIVYKRRVNMSENDALEFMVDKDKHLDSQIGKEIEYFRDFYQELEPSMIIIYDRYSYGMKNSDLRITFDTNVRYRADNLTLSSALYGTLVLDSEHLLMEIKTSMGLPLWLTKMLNENKIYKTTFSKYGSAYKLQLEKEKTLWNFSTQSSHKTL